MREAFGPDARYDEPPTPTNARSKPQSAALNRSANTHPTNSNDFGKKLNGVGTSNVSTTLSKTPPMSQGYTRTTPKSTYTTPTQSPSILIPTSSQPSPIFTPPTSSSIQNIPRSQSSPNFSPNISTPGQSLSPKSSPASQGYQSAYSTPGNIASALKPQSIQTQVSPSGGLYSSQAQAKPLSTLSRSQGSTTPPKKFPSAPFLQTQQQPKSFQNSDFDMEDEFFQPQSSVDSYQQSSEQQPFYPDPDPDTLMFDDNVADQMETDGLILDLTSEPTTPGPPKKLYSENSRPTKLLAVSNGSLTTSGGPGHSMLDLSEDSPQAKPQSSIPFSQKIDTFSPIKDFSDPKFSTLFCAIILCLCDQRKRQNGLGLTSRGQQGSTPCC